MAGDLAEVFARYAARVIAGDVEGIVALYARSRAWRSRRRCRSSLGACAGSSRTADYAGAAPR
jgi:hypothetical protein